MMIFKTIFKKLLNIIKNKISFLLATSNLNIKLLFYLTNNKKDIFPISFTNCLLYYSFY
jgi:hypothetical protein